MISSTFTIPFSITSFLLTGIVFIRTQTHIGVGFRKGAMGDTRLVATFVAEPLIRWISRQWSSNAVIVSFAGTVVTEYGRST